jgi:hypothetical protein
MTRRNLVGSLAAGAAGGAVAARAQAAETRVPRFEFAFEVRALIESALLVGPSAHGLRRIIPIAGGSVQGPKLKGRVLPGGADWQFVRPDGVLELEAKYTLQAEDGALIMVSNSGLRHGPPEIMARLAAGEPVDPSEYYFRTTARFEAPLGGPHEWLNKAIFLGVAEREPQAAIIRFYAVV